MFKWLLLYTTLLSTFSYSYLSADCCQSAEVTLGWRRDNLDWKTRRLDSSYVPGRVNSRILFKDINSYTISGKAKWVDSEYYIRFSADYGLTDKGRAKERFQIKSPLIYFPLEIDTSNPVKRRSEVYDFNIAAGYPFTFCHCRLAFIPLIGFSFHRQHLRVKENEHCSSSSYHSSYTKDDSSSYDSSSSCSCCSSESSSSCCCCSSSDFSVSSSNFFIGYPSSNPFSSQSSSDENIASVLGLSNPHHTQNYRFTWYGFYIGADIAYALDTCWTIFSEFEYHFYDNCHRKRKSWTGVYFVDDYHKKGWAYGFNSIVGITYAFSTCWYSTIAIDFNWWKAHSHNDDLYWNMVGARIGLGYVF